MMLDSTGRAIPKVPAPLCDYWLEDRSKCRNDATHRTVDAHGAPYGFCEEHWLKMVASPPASEPRDHESKAPHTRILWNERDGEIDEIVMRDVEMVHIEQMDDGVWWIGINLKGGGYWSGNFSSQSKTRMTFTEQEREDFEWDIDRSHTEKP